jgi:hypothetical protein
MTDKVQYSIVNSEQGAISVQSTIKSFNLDHVTSKDIKSFYSNFSQYAAWDTGLLPVDGSGILSIRTAGEYTQFAYQHSPGMYHINWAATEGSSHASAYYLAQPYRIIICDMKEGNLLGARTFYSPYPITNPSQPLYHVNLPNINCKGYRGNGVGWICLYQQEDWSALPLNERIVRFIERCSGVETYNDANMSETDGTRFYKNQGKPDYTWDPLQWQNKSEQEGFGWTLDPDLWIPVLVESMDSQSCHKQDGQPLTFADALVGDYKAYYYDEKSTKPINAIIRPDKQVDSNEVLSYFVRSYNGATAQANPLLDDTFNTSARLKENKSSSIFGSSPLLNTVESHTKDQDEDEFDCGVCDNTCPNSSYAITDPSSMEPVCNECFDLYYVYIKNIDEHFHVEHEEIVYDEKTSNHYHINYDTVAFCQGCGAVHATSSNLEKDKKSIINKVLTLDNGDSICPDCIDSYASDTDLNTDQCYGSCGSLVLTDFNYSNSYPSVSFVVPFINQDSTVLVKPQTKTFCQSCASKFLVCPCGLIKSQDSDDFNSCTNTLVSTQAGSVISVSKACASCVTPVELDEQGLLSSSYKPFDQSIQKVYINSSPLINDQINQGWSYESYQEDIF